MIKALQTSLDKDTRISAQQCRAMRWRYRDAGPGIRMWNDLTAGSRSILDKTSAVLPCQGVR